MGQFTVSYSIRTGGEVVVEAESAEQAAAIVKRAAQKLADEAAYGTTDPKWRFRGIAADGWTAYTDVRDATVEELKDMHMPRFNSKESD